MIIMVMSLQTDPYIIHSHKLPKILSNGMQRGQTLYQSLNQI